MEARHKKLIVIVGSTAVGKTAVSIKLAQHFTTEIISADSRQIFKELTIGTAKPNEEDLAAIPHHFINSHSINECYDAAQFGHEALELIHQLFKKYDYLILCGGSGLYIKAVLEGFDDIPDVDDEIRAELNRQYEKDGIAWLQEKMQALDPEHFQIIDQQNPHRLMRALEVKIGTGLSISTFRKKIKLEHPFSIVKIGLELPREVLNKRIDERMDQMIRDGLFEEAKNVFHFKDQQALQTVGYKEIFDFMEGQYDREEAVRLLKRNSRRYAKRQMTWFKKDLEIHWVDPKDFNKVIDFV